jgi:hypothetical protein
MDREPGVTDDVEAIKKERSGHEAILHEVSRSSISKSRPTLMGIERALCHGSDLQGSQCATGD